MLSTVTDGPIHASSSITTNSGMKQFEWIRTLFPISFSVSTTEWVPMLTLSPITLFSLMRTPWPVSRRFPIRLPPYMIE